MLSEGEYTGTVISQGMAATKNGNPQLWLQVRIDNETDSQGAPLSRTIYWTITEKTVDFVVEKLERLGYVPSSWTELDPQRENHYSYVDVVATLYCKHEEYDGKVREKWDLSNPGFGAPEPLEGDKLRKLDSLFGKQLKARATKKSKPAPAEAEPAAASSKRSDDIPF